MLVKITLLVVVLKCVCSRDVDIIFKLDSKHLIESLTSEKSVKYITELAQAFAKKAAETFINEIKNKKHLFNKKRKKRSKLVKVDRVQKIMESKYHDEDVLTEGEAFKLLEKPSPDGDNLDWHAPQDLTAEMENTEEPKTKKKRIPVYGLKKAHRVPYNPASLKLIPEDVLSGLGELVSDQ
ncbi:hypothetical protein KGM_210074 [Danaus plexippus plexippus]|uniref:Uncharacterized protein n=1 Tax=Danaus plexippus plexippus TaxID=278856 RepID=A0A212EW13_DANPL|nr:hypothetical protein KGM_210074 [Danaus plexippus plexippus]